MKKRLQWLGLLALLAACLLTACGPKENCAEAHNDDRTYRLGICTDKRKYDFGEPIHITFTVTNISDGTLKFDGGDKPALDIGIAQRYWSDGRELTPDLTQVTLEPGESRTIELVWPTPGTDLEEISFPPEGGLTSIGVQGIVRPFPGTDRAVGVYAYYRRP